MKLGRTKSVKQNESRCWINLIKTFQNLISYPIYKNVYSLVRKRFDMKKESLRIPSE